MFARKLICRTVKFAERPFQKRLVWVYRKQSVHLHVVCAEKKSYTVIFKELF